jgi:hypothetical protein
LEIDEAIVTQLNLAGQQAVPMWARGRTNGAVSTVACGAMALGGAVWGSVASMIGVTSALLAGAFLCLLSLMLAFFFTIDVLEELDFTPASITGYNHKLLHVPRPSDGRISISYELQVEMSLGLEFVHLMREVRLIHLRNGAFSWHLHEDLGRANVYRIEMMCPSWTQHILRMERYTKQEQEVLQKLRSLHIGDEPPVERIYLCIEGEITSDKMASGLEPVHRP